MNKVLKLYNNFTRSLNPVRLSGELVTTTTFNSSRQSLASFYICGPTVYSDSHLGHALTYVRADLFRRWMKSLFNIRLVTVMNITDIDDKIIRKVSELDSQNKYMRGDAKSPNDPSSHPFNIISNRYYKSFLDDMSSIRVLPPDLSVRVTHQVPSIINYIRRLESNGNAYIAPTGDILFRVKSIPSYSGRRDKKVLHYNDDQVARPDEENLNSYKEDPRDFVLWKPSKENEPLWEYRSSTSNRIIYGRPGWHVQCATIAGSIFGKHLDFHFGGKDLEFPHHYNEEACSCAFHRLDSSKSLHVWSKNWLHSGHLVVKDEKMSKSLSNMVSIKELIQDTSINVLRLLCIHSHYRSDIDYNQDLLDKMKACDHKISAFYTFLNDALETRAKMPLYMSSKTGDVGSIAQDSFVCHSKDATSITNNPNPSSANISLSMGDEFIGTEIHGQEIDKNRSQCGLSADILRAREKIIEGLCEDFKLDLGLYAILDLSRKLYAKGKESIRTNELVASRSLLQDWCDSCGLRYGLQSMANEDLQHVTSLVETLLGFRHLVRITSLSHLEVSNELTPENSKRMMMKLLNECDNIRAKLGALGVVKADPKSFKE